MQVSHLRFTNFGLRFTLFACLLLVCACSSTTPTPEGEPLRVQYTFAAQPWLTNLSDCAGNTAIKSELRSVGYLDLNNVNLDMRTGINYQPDLPTFQIGTEDILVVINPQNPAGKLTADQVHGLFSGQIRNWQEINHSNAPVQVWVFASGEDVQQIFDQTILGDIPVTSLARQASSSDEMAQAVAKDVNAIGILTRHWKAGNVTEAYSVATVPVLAITPSKPQGALAELIACLQK